MAAPHRLRPHSILAPAALTLGALAAVFAPAVAEQKPAAARPPGNADRPMLPSPYKPGPVEAEHLARYDKATAAVRATVVSEADAAALRDAVKAFAGGKRDDGLQHRGRIGDPLARKIADWHRLRSGHGTAAEYREFLDKNPAWPDRTLLTQRLEEALYTQGGSSREIRSIFAKGGPNYGTGFAALASSYLADGDTEQARTYAVKAWREKTIPAALEAGFLDRFGKLLTLADHKARLAVFLQKDNARALIENAPAGEGADWGFVFHKIQSLRRADRIDEAAKIMLTVPTDAGALANNDEWWVERRTMAYAALRKGIPRLAYAIVREAGPLSVNPLKDQSFMAGWLALRHLKSAEKARPHFEAMLKAADGPLSRAKAHYWLGRTAEALKDTALAHVHYKDAVRDPDTFHGLLGMQKLEPGRQAFPITPPAAPTAEEIERFKGLDAVKALVVAHKAKLDRSIQRAFLIQLRFHLDSEAELAMVAHLSEALGDTQTAVRTAKAAIAERKNLLTYAYPVHPFPAYAPLRKPPEPAFLLGIARQETEFNTLTVSGAGAKGLLQVMTVTAQHVCRDYKIKCDIKRLLSDPAYNTMMGSAYIGDRMQDFSGSYILTLAGYNAGPGRARQWIREFGDPRDPRIDPIDWIERIPIQETREYVAKVLANVQVYRARLGAEDVALQLDRDLLRARLAAGEAPATTKDASREESLRDEAASDG